MPTLTQPFAQSNGVLRFQETEIYLENVTSRFGSIPAIANGIIDLQKGYNLKAKTEPIRVQQVVESLKLKKPPVPIVGELKADIRVTGSTPQPGQPLTSPVVSVDAITTKTTRIDRVDFRPGSTAQLQLIGSNLSVTQFQATPTVGGQLTGKGKIKVESRKSKVESNDSSASILLADRTNKVESQNSEYKFDVNAINVPAGAIARLYQTTLPINPGLVSGRAQFLGTLENSEQLKATGAASFKLGDGSVNASNFQYANRRWQGNIQASGVNLTSLNPKLPQQVHQGRLNGIFNVSGGIDSFAPESIRATGSANVAIANGTVTANNITLANGRWVTTVKAQGIDSDRILPNLPSQFTGILNGTFDLAGSTHTSLQNIRGNGTANLTLPQGKIEAENIQLANGEFKAVVRPNEVALKQLYKEGRGTLDGKLNIFGNLEKPALADVRASGELTFSQGVGALVRPLTTAIDWNGQRLNIRQAIATGIQASGWADIAPELLGTPKAIKQFELQVAALEVDVKAFAIPLPDNIAKVSYSGNLDFDGTIAGTLQSPRIEGDLNLDKLQVASLEFDRTLKGTVKGIPEKGINIDLAGIQDRIQLALDPKYQPTSFDIELDRMNVSGIRKNEQLQIKADNIQVDLFKNIAKASQITLPEAILSQPLSGELSGNFAFNLQTSELSGEDVAIANPHLGTLKGDRITSSFRYFNNNLTFKNALFQKNDSQYLLNGSLINIQSSPQLEAEIAVSKGQIQDVLQTLQIFELSDLARGLNPPIYAKAADLYEGRNQDAPVGANGRSPVPQSGIQKSPHPPDSRTDAIYRVSTPQTPLFNIGTPQAPILEQLSRFSEIETLLRMQRKKRQEASPLPELAELQGTFDGKLTVSAAPKSEIKASFDFQGKAWQWRDYIFNQIDLKGGLQDGIVTLEPVRVQSGESLFAFSGSVGGKIPSGRLQLNNIPLELLSEFVEVPPTIAIGGLLNGNVTLAGSRDNPQANGELAIANATINQTALSTTQGSFTYDKSRLDFQASSKLNPQAEPIVVQGSIPYQLPFATVKPDSDRLQLNLQVQNEGIALLDIISRDALSWIDGQGEIAIDISGRFDQKQGRPNQLRAEGIATFNNATIGAQVLPNAPLTEVNGKILFNFDRVDVESLTGKFSGGKVAVAGSLPLIESKPQKNPLTVTLDNLALNLKGLYQGGVQGQVKIAGSALEPISAVGWR
ncbi:MAG: hypothetical protein HC784_01185 [Hydrococcus sp. CSU_1_8]|nr:hypothetical protein [Hydrococcus sp. CSU_1_8]